MARKAKPIECGAKDRQVLERLSRSRTEPRQLVERARMVLGCVADVAVQQTARECHTRPNTVIKWRDRFVRLAAHPNVRFHYTPTSASWLNQVEIWFGILSRKALRGLSTTSTEELRTEIEAFIARYSQNAKPFKWRKREVKGAQLRNTIVNLCN